jgi:DNA polymerase IV
VRAIIHVDMDAFYASVEERDRPEIAGRPVIVGGTPEGRGVVSAANYAARRYGVHSAMPAVTARRLCPHGVFLPVRMEHYAEVARQIRDVFQRYTPEVEPLSLDEAFLEVSASERLFGPAAQIARRIKREIGGELGLVASVGVAPNKFLAKIASDVQKPNGFVVVGSDRVQEFLDPLPVGRLWGVGRVAEAVLKRLGIGTIAELRARGPALLREHFGRSGEQLWELAHGRDERAVVPDHRAKSISQETTFPEDIADPQVLRAWLGELAEQVAWRLRRHGLHGRTVQLKVRFADFRLITRAQTLPQLTDRTRDIQQAAAMLLSERLPAAHPPVRLLGVGISALGAAGPAQTSLFEQETARQRELDAVADRIRQRFGGGAIRRGGGTKGA